MSTDFQNYPQQPVPQDATYQSGGQIYAPPVIPPSQDLAGQPYTSPQPQPYVQQPQPQPYVQQPQPQPYVIPDPNAQQYAPAAQTVPEYPKGGEGVPGSDDTITWMMRRGFIVKTYGIIIAQLALTLAFICLSFFKGVRDILFGNPQTTYVLLIICTVLIIVISLMLSCSRTLSRTVPTNYILLFFFTLCLSYYVMVLCSFYTTESVLFALALTIGATVGLTIYASRTTTDFTYCGGFLFSFCFILFIAGLLSIFWWGMFNIIIYECLGVCLYSLYLIYDTQLILGQMGRKFSVEDYVLAALNVYIDIIYLFIKILSLFGKSR